MFLAAASVPGAGARIGPRYVIEFLCGVSA
jgi:hypothetical protein